MPAQKPTSQQDPRQALVVPPPPTVQGTFDTVLPVGLKEPGGERVREFELHEHTAEDLSVIRDARTLARQPIQYLMRLVAMGLERVGKHQVYAEFAAGDFKKVPKIIEGLPLTDAEYLLVASQIHSYGQYSESDWQCAVCNTKNAGKFDLSKIDITKFPDDDAPYEPIVTVELERGLEFKSEAWAQFSSVVWNLYTMEMPTLGQLLHVERVSSGARKKNQTRRQRFDTKVLHRSVVQIAAQDGSVMPTDMKNMLGEGVIAKLKARDMILLGRFIFDTLPRMDREIIVECEQCGSEAKEGLDPTMLLPVG